MTTYDKIRRDVIALVRLAAIAGAGLFVLWAGAGILIGY